jgi:hypothetical protein
MSKHKCVLWKKSLIIKQAGLVSDFIKNIKVDSRIITAHICLYVSLVKQLYAKGRKNPLSIFSKDMMEMFDISGVATYYRSLRQLHDYGYLSDVPSYNHFLISLVYFR